MNKAGGCQPYLGRLDSVVFVKDAGSPSRLPNSGLAAVFCRQKSFNFYSFNLKELDSPLHKKPKLLGNAQRVDCVGLEFPAWLILLRLRRDAPGSASGTRGRSGALSDAHQVLMHLSFISYDYFNTWCIFRHKIYIIYGNNAGFTKPDAYDM